MHIFNVSHNSVTFLLYEVAISPEHFVWLYIRRSGNHMLSIFWLWFTRVIV